MNNEDELEKILNSMYNNIFKSYEERLIANTVINNTEIDTCEVSDGINSYETAIRNPIYNNNNWVTVQSYKTSTEAKTGHEKWVKLFSEKLPVNLHNIDNTKLGRYLYKVFDINFSTIYKRRDEQ
jgi:stress response protein YsnF